MHCVEMELGTIVLIGIEHFFLISTDLCDNFQMLTLSGITGPWSWSRFWTHNFSNFDFFSSIYDVLLKILLMQYEWYTSYHTAHRDGDGPPTIRVWDYVTVAHRQKSDWNHPHGVQNVLMSMIKIAVEKTTRNLVKF